MLVFVRGVCAVFVYDQPGHEATLVKQVLPEYHIDLISESSRVALLELSRSIRHFLRGSETSGLAMLLVQTCGAETFSSVSPNSRPGTTMFLYGIPMSLCLSIDIRKIRIGGTHKSSRLFSTSPYLTLGTRVKEVLPGGCKIADVLLFDPVEEELVTVPDKTISKELMDQEMVGASHGWGFFCARHDRSTSGFYAFIDIFEIYYVI
ncbi:hypothetical protein F2Q69_00012464 [Brassica cretica]|uniref:Uncharacterized protein n=1 Tax=Brassica cretica TaxID=69181 RepID=A0A8S9QLD2_BRACR|nr:hypothetical protein F2Q69_00012464 [Brassica cretica]